MIQNIKNRKVITLATIFFCMVLFVPSVQASTVNCQENERIFADATSLDEVLSLHYQTMDKSKIACNNENGVHVDTFPLADFDISEFATKEEYDRFMCVPEDFTPDQIIIRDKTDEVEQRASSCAGVSAILIIDEEAKNFFGQLQWPYPTTFGCYIIADNILEDGDDYLEYPYGIDFITEWSYICFWNSPNYMDYYGLLAEISKVDPTGVGCDVIVLMSAQFGGTYSNGGGIMGLANAVTDRHFVMDVFAGMRYAFPIANLFQHEASHLFDCSDHGNDLTYCIMSYTYDQSYRGYCTGCDTQLWLNRCRFD